MVDILHDTPAVAAPEHALFGAAWFGESRENGERLPEHWGTFTFDQLALVQDKGFELLYGSTPEELEAQLQAKFPSAPGTTRIICTSQYRDDGPAYWQRKPGRWVILDYPLLAVTPATVLAEVQRWTAALGHAVLVPLAQLPDELVPEEAWRRLGFAVRGRYPALRQLSLAPRQAAKHVLAADRAAYQERMRGYFDWAALSYLEEVTDVRGWPWREAGWPLSAAILHPDSRRVRAGIGDYSTSRADGPELARTADCVARIFLGFQLARRLLKVTTPWWREAGSFREVCRRLVDHLHGVEARARESASPEHTQVLKFCRWLRRECRAAKIVIPPAPRPPVPSIPKKTSQRGKSRDRPPQT